MTTRLIATLALSLAAVAGHAQNYPARAINITVPNPPGGMNQIHAQPLSAVFERLTKQPAPIVNRPGGTSALGTAYIANQPADGYNILVSTANLHLVIEKNKVFGIQSPYSFDQIEYLALLSADPIILAVHPSMPVKNPKELTAIARKKPNEIVYSTSGAYGVTFMPIAMYLDADGIRMRHLPTTGGGPAILQALGGHSQVTSGGPAALYGHLQSKKLRALASFGLKPHPAVPEAPTFASMGYKDVEAYLWVGLFTAKGMPAPQLAQLRQLIARAAADPAFKQALEKVRVVPDFREGDDFKRFFDADHRRMAAIMKKIGKM
jgi:tripartite-type tricarboxylate transporter receptor subunit TctC